MSRLLPCLALVCLFLGTSAASAQPARRPLLRRPLPAWLDLHVDRRGGVRAKLQLPARPPECETWQQALVSLLNGAPTEFREETSGGWWVLHARADAVLGRNDWTIEGDFDLNPLREVLDRYFFGAGQLTITIHHSSTDFSTCSLEDGLPSSTFLDTSYSADLPVAEPPLPIHLRFGFHRENTWRFLPLLFVLLMPIGLTLWRRRPRPGEDDRFVAWFRYWRFERRLAVLLWCAWLAAVALLGVASLASSLLCWTLGAGEFVWTALFLTLPPALTALTCRVLSSPAFACVPEVGWTRGRLLHQGAWMQLGLVGIGICLGCGVDSLLWNHLALSGLMYLLAAAGLLILCFTVALMSRSNALNVLPPGPLRERLFELAEQARVKVRQAFRLSPAAWRLLNAVGVIDGVHVCPDVLPHLSRREVDALLALELARLWRRRRFSWWQMLGTIALVSIVGIGIGLVALFTRSESVWPFVPILFVTGVAWRLRQPDHHFMAHLDGGALAITGDPEALITALAKLRQLHLLPLSAGEDRNASIPVAEWNRLLDLADRAGIPPDRLDEILDGPGSGADRYPPLEAAPDPTPGADSRVFSREFKRRSVFWQSWTGLAIEVAIPVLFAWLVQSRRWHGLLLALAYLAGLLLAFLLRQVFVYRLAMLTSHALERGVRARLAQEGLRPEEWDGIAVSLSPHDEPRVYESFLIWDPGFLVLSGDRLCYLGDQTRFAIERRHIRDVSLGPDYPVWSFSRRVYISWWDEERGTGGVFNVTASGRGKWWRSARPQRELAQRLCDWLKQPHASDAVLPLLSELPPPDLGAVPSESLGKFAAVNVLVGLLFLRSPFALVACLVLGLSFDWRTGAAGWYVLGSVVLLQTLTVLSFLPYRGRAGDTADADAPAPGSD